jgi:flagellar motility protein MotE (MotC chaperone)
MKKILIVIQVVILILILAKAATFSGLLKKTNLISEENMITNQALAQQATGTQAPAVTTTPAAPQESSSTQTVSAVQEHVDDNLAKQRDLAAALIIKKIELDNRENALRAEEQRLITLRKEITDKISLLKGQEEKLASVLDATQMSEVKRFKEMAKVYEATPAAKAGPMLEKLDTKTAAGITMNMKKDKAGAIWGYITPQKAVDITKEITRVSGKQQAE